MGGGTGDGKIYSGLTIGPGPARTTQVPRAARDTCVHYDNYSAGILRHL